MANKQKLKKSESKIIVYLSQTPIELHSVKLISLKLNQNYAYTIQILTEMKFKKWLITGKSNLNKRMTYYHLTKKGKELIEKSKNGLL